MNIKECAIPLNSCKFVCEKFWEQPSTVFFTRGLYYNTFDSCKIDLWLFFTVLQAGACSCGNVSDRNKHSSLLNCSKIMTPQHST
jgi:hypothetical protein